MKVPPSADAAAALAELKNNWTGLKHDLDQAQAIMLVKGISLREIAGELKCSESRLRNLLVAAEAPPVDLLRARKGLISTRELVRRSRAAKANRAAEDKGKSELERTKRVQKGCEVICNWLKEENQSGAHGEAIVEEARRILAEAERDGKLPKAPSPREDMPLEEIIRRCRPPEFVNADVGYVGWYADWLARWAFFAFPSSVIRHQTLNLAWDVQVKWMPDRSARNN
jgi:hypothetical protein